MKQALHRARASTAVLGYCPLALAIGSVLLSGTIQAEEKTSEDERRTLSTVVVTGNRGAPTQDERAQPYLWRFWRQIPARGKFTIFDRSWYGRVLVERVEGFCSESDWKRAYAEINDFEEQLTDAGIVVVKFWLAIDQQTQLERFQEREKIPFKRYKITEDDWRNRKKWPDYRQAVGDMVDRTSTEIAPWTLIEANDKRWARVKVLRTINEALEKAFGKDKKK